MRISFRKYARLLATAGLALACACALLTPSASAATKKVIIDTDPGTDDAIAILLALNSPELDVRALTVVPGNVTAAQQYVRASQAELDRLNAFPASAGMNR
jgi:hypothetical protein